MHRTLTATVTAALLGTSTNAAALVVTPENDGTALVDTIVGSGITVDTSSIAYKGASGQAGTFTGGTGAGIGIDVGILLTSGRAKDAEGPNTADNTGLSHNADGDSDLDALIPGYGTNDANVLEFEFETTGGDLYFNYAFGSEEYNEFVDSDFNDVFGFFVDGTNIARLPDGDPVSINTVNCGDDLAGAGTNCSAYNNNDLTDGAASYALEYDGFTDVFTAKALGLSAGTHTMKLAIADAGDYILDSGVFIQGQSFSDEPTADVPEPGALGLLGLGLLGLLGSSRKYRN